MSSKRLSFDDEGSSKGPGGLKGLLMKGQALGNTGLGLAQWTAQKTGRTAWILLTTACVTLLPLYFEITREAQMIEHEKMQVNALLAEGRTRQEIAAMGLYSALDPNVLGPEASK